MSISVTSSRRTLQRAARHRRLRMRVHGTAQRPRLSVFRSARHLTVQLIDDKASRTIIGLTDAHLVNKPSDDHRTPGVARAFALGKLLATQAVAQGVTSVVFDRGGYTYHGHIKAVADGAREGGLSF